MDAKTLNECLPIVPHDPNGADCCGCIFVRIEGQDERLVCDECGAEVGRVNANILVGLLGIDAAKAICQHCSKVSTFPGCVEIEAFVWQHCGQGVTLGPRTVN